MDKSFQFSTLAFKPEIKKAMLANLNLLGYTDMTPIQAKSLPSILKNQDVIAQAKTGSGKTAAYGIGLLSKLNVKNYHAQVQALVICPTRELAEQVGKEIQRLARFAQNIKLLSLCGGKPFAPQKNSLAYGTHIVVGTPGRIQDHLSKDTLNLENVHSLVLDEADRMLDMGFYNDIINIISNIPKKRQTMLFSATFPGSIVQMSRSIQKRPLNIRVESLHSHNEIEQLFYEIGKSQWDRDKALIALLAHYQPKSTVIFCNTKKQCQEVTMQLKKKGYYAMAIHGDLEQRDRDLVLLRFANKSCSILVATDVAARGLDIDNLQMVINYELPKDPKIHIHRIGRTGRAGKKGSALSLYTASEQQKISAIEKIQNQPCHCDVLNLLDDNGLPSPPSMITVYINGGKKNKMRPGDILGALTGDIGIPGNQVGKINIFDFSSYVALDRKIADKVLKHLKNSKIKGHQFKVRKLGD
ncbi:ATP-dependent RNA helicase DbpA [Candidatus Parabeggiatoa sp. HSG14]|uniref:ATP-dependent RNA helicase DbpA n=1 Tax=Candidatus Parabeggiatoa sp. HSG14 TaxID=3055593 RepID=UPI0025A8A05F|nr:ATP-dependent RNA helicase DbpA [Thiotrichales bacterium HSG14]